MRRGIVTGAIYPCQPRCVTHRLTEFAGNPHLTLKLVFNEVGAVISPGNHEHNTMKIPGVSYEHDHEGNALAAMVTAGKIEIRFHTQFSDERFMRIVSALIGHEAFAVCREWFTFYQGRPLP